VLFNHVDDIARVLLGQPSAMAGAAEPGAVPASNTPG
jgi:hypothetical protein